MLAFYLDDLGVVEVASYTTFGVPHGLGTAIGTLAALISLAPTDFKAQLVERAISCFVVRILDTLSWLLAREASRVKTTAATCAILLVIWIENRVFMEKQERRWAHVELGLNLDIRDDAPEAWSRVFAPRL